MANTIHVDIVSAERELFSGEATMVFAPAVQGEVGIAPMHTPLLTPLNPGDVRVQTADGGEEIIYVSGGLLEVQPHVVTILSDTALRAEDIDEQAVLRAKEDAERTLSDKSSVVDEARARAEILQAVAQLGALRKLRGRR
ncbi:MAG: F-type H+-transporting ATPase subunit epsilon [Gammaproteobacteria bacterium]|jgi:F-type H+-transporting ATPase subunit epsilon